MKKPRLNLSLAGFRAGFTGGDDVANALVPPVAFVLLDPLLGFQIAGACALAAALIITAVRLGRRQPVGSALGGLGGVVVAVLIARWAGRVAGYFLPGVIMGWVWAAVALGSIILGRPLAAWASHAARRWPLDWYWHPQVRPAYSRVTWLWVVFLGARSAGQMALYRLDAAVVLLLSSWPATIVVLLISYLYGSWLLRRLGGPGVEEFRAGVGPPWEGQRQGP
jgi:hypothetical protein